MNKSSKEELLARAASLPKMSLNEFNLFPSKIAKLIEQKHNNALVFAVHYSKEEADKGLECGLELGSPLMIVHFNPFGDVHRTNGPAIEFIERDIIEDDLGYSYDEYWLNGKSFSEDLDEWQEENALWVRWENQVRSTPNPS